MKGEIFTAYRSVKKEDFAKKVDFKDLLPKIQIEKVRLDPLYEKAFLNRDEKTSTEFNQNTTTWD